jgi:hybrid polyketide synthase / nonribosomal peptide synthetase ACE1
MAFQGILVAYTYPDDGQLRSIHVPQRIGRLSVNPSLCKARSSQGPLPFISTHEADTLILDGNTTIYPDDPGVNNAMVQIEDMGFVPLSRTRAHENQEAFAIIRWGLLEPDTKVLAAYPDGLSPP